MDFFNSFPLDLKILAIGIAGCALLALFSGNARTEKRYLFVLVLLGAAGVYRFMHTVGNEPPDTSVAATRLSHGVTPPPKHVPLVSTSAK
jgi:hypothetical protein